MPVAFRDYYEVLGVPRDASEEDIRRAYRKLARENHPDVNKQPEADTRFKAIAEAYEVLRDPEKRERYDRLGANWKAGQDVSDASGFGGFDPSAGRGFGSDGFQDVRVDFGGGDFSDFFEGLFGARTGGGSGRRARGGFDGFTTRGGDEEAVIELSLEDAIAGGPRRITLPDGRDYEVSIPAGVRDGQLIRLAGEGRVGIGGGPSGDFLLRVRLRPHPRFRVEGSNLHTDLAIAPWEAALGASIELETLRGRRTVKVPAGSSCGRRLRLRGEGMPGGDLYAAVQIKVPKTLSRDERELFERLAEASSFDPRRSG